MAFDSSFKNILKRLFAGLGVTVITESEVPVANQRIDFLIPNNPRLKGTPFFHARELVIGEFKSERDRLFPGDLLMLISKAYSHLAVSYGYAGKRSELPKSALNQVSCVLILGGNKSIETLSPLGLDFQELEAGVHEYQGLLHLLVIELDKIREMGDMDLLLLFASKQRRRQVIQDALTQNDRFISSVSYLLYKKEWQEMSTDPESISIKEAVEFLGVARVINEVGLERVIQEVGINRVVDAVGLEKVVEAVGLEKVVDAVGLEKVVDAVGLEKLVKSIDPKKISPEVKQALQDLLNKINS